MTGINSGEMNGSGPQAAASLPLFYSSPAVLRADLHATAGLGAPDGYGFAKGALAVPLVAAEFMPAIRHYPIVFSATDTPMPLAVLGIAQGHNLFIEQDSDPKSNWREGYYIPAYVRRYPFILVEEPGDTTRHLAIDAACDRFRAQGCVENGGADQEAVGKAAQRFFDTKGAPTPQAQAIMGFCEAYHGDHLRTQALMAALQEAKLLVTNRADFQLPGGSRQSLDGFQVVDEEAYRALPVSLLKDWHRKGWCDAIALHLASRQNWQVLLDLNLIRSNQQKADA